MNEIVRMTVGSAGIALSDVIVVDDIAYNLTGSSVKFSMRPDQSITPKINHVAATIVTPAAGQVRYTWQAADVDTAGDYLAWWTVTPAAGTTFDTPEFLVLMDAHGPGDTVVTGDVAEKLRQHIPQLYKALTSSVLYGDAYIQARIDYAKYYLFASTVAPALEAITFNPLVVDYLAKLAAVDIIPAGVDFFRERPIAINLRGTNETESFPDSIAALWQLHARFVFELKRDRPLIDGIVPRRRGSYPAIRQHYPEVTPHPGAFGAMYATSYMPAILVSSWD